jgi:hypothetical protein
MDIGLNCLDSFFSELREGDRPVAPTNSELINRSCL